MEGRRPRRLVGKVEAGLEQGDATWDRRAQRSHPKRLGSTESEAGCRLHARRTGVLDGEGSKELSYLVEAC